MSSINGYGPPGSRYPHQIFVHGIRPTNMGTELTVVLDDSGQVHQLKVSFPPDDTEWRGKFLHVVDPGPPELRSATLVAPPGAAIVAFQCLDADGRALPELCCMFRLQQGDWLADVAPDKVPELVQGQEEIRAEQEDMDQRLYSEAGGFNCCICGNIVRSDKGYRFEQLAGDTVRAIRLESAMADSFPFICGRCYKRKFGGISAHAIGSVSSLEGLLARVLLLVFRGYLAGLFWWNVSPEVPPDSQLMVAGFVGCFLPFETIPGTLFQMAKNPMILLAVVFVPVLLLLFAAVKAETTLKIFEDPSSAWYYLGLENLALIRTDVAQYAALGALAGIAVGWLFGFLDPKDEKPQGKILD